MKKFKFFLILVILMGFQAGLSFACQHCSMSQAEIEKAAGVKPSMSFQEKLPLLLLLEYGDSLEKLGGNTPIAMVTFTAGIAVRLAVSEGFIGYLKRLYGDAAKVEFPGYMLNEEAAQKIFDEIKNLVKTKSAFNPLTLDNNGPAESPLEPSSLQNTSIDSASNRTSTTTTPIVEEM